MSMPVLEDVRLRVTPALLNDFADMFRTALGRVESVHCRIAFNSLTFIDPAIYAAFSEHVVSHLRPMGSISLHALQRHFLRWSSEPLLRTMDKEALSAAPYVCIFNAAMNGIGDDDLRTIIIHLNKDSDDASFGTGDGSGRLPKGHG